MMDIKPKVNLDVGCGSNKQHGFIGIDKRKLETVDIVHDLEVFPWPLEDESCCTVLMSHFVEHVSPAKQIDLINEAWRILEPDGLLIISTPYPNSFGWHQDPTHCASWNEATPHYFVPGNQLYNVYEPKPWKIENISFDLRTTLEVAMRKVGDGRK
jgi:predicted SAM-dependent methyltransferase